MDNQGHNLVWIGMIILGVIFGLLLFGVPGALAGGVIMLVVGAFATKPKNKPDVEKS